MLLESIGRERVFGIIIMIDLVLVFLSRRLDAVNFFHSNKHLAHSVQLTLKKLPDVERLFQKISVSNSSTLDLNSLLSAIQLAG